MWTDTLSSVTFGSCPQRYAIVFALPGPLRGMLPRLGKESSFAAPTQHQRGRPSYVFCSELPRGFLAYPVVRGYARMPVLSGVRHDLHPTLGYDWLRELIGHENFTHDAGDAMGDRCSVLFSFVLLCLCYFIFCIVRHRLFAL